MILWEVYGCYGCVETKMVDSLVHEWLTPPGPPTCLMHGLFSQNTAYLMQDCFRQKHFGDNEERAKIIVPTYFPYDII